MVTVACSYVHMRGLLWFSHWSAVIQISTWAAGLFCVPLWGRDLHDCNELVTIHCLYPQGGTQPNKTTTFVVLLLFLFSHSSAASLQLLYDLFACLVWYAFFVHCLACRHQSNWVGGMHTKTACSSPRNTLLCHCSTASLLIGTLQSFLVCCICIDKEMWCDWTDKEGSIAFSCRV